MIQGDKFFNAVLGLICLALVMLLVFMGYEIYSASVMREKANLFCAEHRTTYTYQPMYIGNQMILMPITTQQCVRYEKRSAVTNSFNKNA